MENKINVAELLRNCPKGMEFDCLLCNSPIALKCVDYASDYPIRAICKDGFYHVFTKYGTSYNHDDAKCVILPKGKTSWEGFIPPCKFKDGDVVTSVFQGVVQGTGIFDYEEQSEACIHVRINLHNEFSTDGYLGYVHDLRFATEEERQKLFDAIKANGYKWKSDTKTLEKFIEPKFKVGDKIREIRTGQIYTVTDIYGRDDNISYQVDNSGFAISYTFQDEYELAPSKIDINTLVPFESRVLVRDYDIQMWIPTFWGKYLKDGPNCSYLTTNGCYKYCIPYEGNEHLLGTTDDCEEYFKTWSNGKRN